MSATAWMGYLGLAFILGIFGQLIRVAVGLKKLYDKQSVDGEKAPFDSRKLWISIALGGLAGVLTGVVTWDVALTSIERDFILTLMAAGYAGSDVIEGLIERVKSPLAK